MMHMAMKAHEAMWDVPKTLESWDHVTWVGPGTFVASNA